MLFFITGAGTMTRADSERIFQGSSNVTKMQVVSPFSGVGVSMAFTLPNRTQTHYFPMHADGRFEVPNPDGTKTKTALFCYSLPLDASVTQEVGTVGVSVKINSFVDANGETPVSEVNTLTTYTATFKVEYSALPEVGEPPEADEWAQIVDLLNTYYGELSGRVETAEGDIDGLETRMTTAEGDIDGLETRMTAAEDDIDTLRTEIAENAQSIAANHKLIVANSEAIDDINTEQAEQNQRIAAVENKTAQPLMTNVIIDEGTMTRYFNNGTTTSSTVTTGGETEQRVNFCTTYSFTEENFVEDAGSGLFSLTVSAELIERTNDRYLVSLEYADGTAYATAADSVTKNADGSLLIKNIAQPFAGRVVTIAAGQHGTITHFGTAITGQGVQVSTDTTLRAETSKGDSYFNITTAEYYECIEVSAASTSWQFLASLIGPRGEKGETGDGFEIYKTYTSVAAMNADAANVPDGKFVIIETGNTNNPDNSKLYVRTVDGSAPFEFVTDMSGASIKGDKGEPGATYTPSIDTNGVLTWTNNGNLPNPSPVNLKGPSGTVSVAGTQTLPAGSDASVTNSGTPTDARLTFKIPKGDTGAVFTPSVSADGVISWTNNGELSNPAAQNIKGAQGKPGANGATFIPHIDGYTLSWTNDGGLENPDPVLIRGMQGPPGQDGAAATIVVAQTNTTSPGNDAAVSNIGTATNARLVFNIPRGEPGTDGLSLTPKGPFVLNTAYVVGDVATYDNLAYLCYADTAGTTTPDADTAHWQVLSTAATTVGELAAQSSLFGGWWSNLTTNGTKGKIPNFFAISEADWTGTALDDPTMLDDYKPGEWVTVDETSIPGIVDGDIVSFVVRCYGSIEDGVNQTNPTRSLMVLAVYNPYNTPGPGSGNSRILSAAWVPEDTDKNGVAICDLGTVTLQDIAYGSVKMGLADIYFDGSKQTETLPVAENPVRIRLRLAGGDGTVYEFDRTSLKINPSDNTRHAQFERVTLTDDSFRAAEQWFVVVDYDPSRSSEQRYHYTIVRMTLPVMRGAERIDLWQGVDIAYDLGTATLTDNSATIQIPESDINGLALANVLRLQLQVGSTQTEIGLVRCSMTGSFEYAAVVPSEAVSTESGSASVVVARLHADREPQLVITVYPLSSGGGSGSGGGLTAQTYTFDGSMSLAQFRDTLETDGATNIVSIVPQRAGEGGIQITTNETTPRSFTLLAPTFTATAHGELIVEGMAIEGVEGGGTPGGIKPVQIIVSDSGSSNPMQDQMLFVDGIDLSSGVPGCNAVPGAHYQVIVYRNQS